MNGDIGVGTRDIIPIRGNSNSGVNGGVILFVLLYFHVLLHVKLKIIMIIIQSLNSLLQYNPEKAIISNMATK